MAVQVVLGSIPSCNSGKNCPPSLEAVESYSETINIYNLQFRQLADALNPEVPGKRGGFALLDAAFVFLYTWARKFWLEKVRENLDIKISLFSPACVL